MATPSEAGREPIGLTEQANEEFALEACPQGGFESLDEARDLVQRIAHAAALAEREACAKVAETVAARWETLHSVAPAAVHEGARAIRSRELAEARRERCHYCCDCEAPMCLHDRVPCPSCAKRRSR
jgi:hypothetical protein